MKKIVLFLTSLIVWLVLTWPPRPQELIVGFAVSIIVAIIFGDIFTVKPWKLFQPSRHFYFLYYIPVFLYYCLKANIDVAYRVLHPKLPINPGFVKIKTKLKDETALTMLANSITLTPGTLTVDIKDGYIYVHCINVLEKDAAKATEIISQRFENIIRRVFE